MKECPHGNLPQYCIHCGGRSLIGCVQHDCAECQAKKSALDAMTADAEAQCKRADGLSLALMDAQDERDSAREALRAIRDSTYRDAVTLRGMADNFLAAQPEPTK